MTTSLPEAEHTIEYTKPLPVCRKCFEQLEVGVSFSNDQQSGKDTANKLTKCHERKEGAIPVHGEENLSCVRRINPGGGGKPNFQLRERSANPVDTYNPPSPLPQFAVRWEQAHSQQNSRDDTDY